MRGFYITGGTAFVIPLRTNVRSEACDERAGEFVLERWYSRPELIRHRDAFAAFRVVHFGCIGRALGLVEIRNLVVKVLARFDVAFAPCEDGEALVEW